MTVCHYNPVELQLMNCNWIPIAFSETATPRTSPRIRFVAQGCEFEGGSEND